MTLKPTTQWLNKYPIIHPDHISDLEQRAAILEFSGKLPRHEAEAQAHQDYRHDQLVESAAHHLTCLKAAHAAGQTDQGVKHGAMLVLSLRALGHDNELSPPKEVTEKATHTPPDIIKFKPHPADALSIAVHNGESKPLKKGEDTVGKPILDIKNVPAQRSVESRRYGINGRITSGPFAGRKNPHFDYSDYIPDQMKTQSNRPSGITIHQNGKNVVASLNHGFGDIHAFRRGDGGYVVHYDGLKRAHEIVRPYREHVLRALSDHLKAAHGAPYVFTGDEPSRQGAVN